MEIGEKTLFIRNLKDIDKEVMLGIYLYRCLNKKLIEEFFYSKVGKGKEYTEYKIRKFIKFGIIDSVKYGVAYDRALFLTPYGISLIKSIVDVPETLFSRLRAKTVLGIYRSSELKLNERAISHQLELARASLTIQKEHFSNNKFLFFNDKYSMGRYDVAKPDGIAAVPNVDMFLEMDMGTERSMRLCSKWQTYREFLKTESFREREAEICVLFILNIKSEKRRRINLVLNTLKKELWDVIGEGIEFYIDNLDGLLNSVSKSIMPKYMKTGGDMTEVLNLLDETKGFGFKIGRGQALMKFTDDIAFDYYISKMKPNQKEIVTANGVPQEFFLDSYYGRPVSVQKKIDYFERISATFKRNFNRDCKYIVVVEDITELYLDMKGAGINPGFLKNIYFTTLPRLRENLFNEALCQFTCTGEIEHFTDNSLLNPVFEAKLQNIVGGAH